MTSENRKMKSC